MTSHAAVTASAKARTLRKVIIHRPGFGTRLANAGNSATKRYGRAKPSPSAAKIKYISNGPWANANPTAVPDHTAWVEEIVKHAKSLAENENVMITLQQYFGPRFGPKPPPPSPTQEVEGVTRRGGREAEEKHISQEELEARSATYRRSQQNIKPKEAAVEEKKKKKKKGLDTK